MIEGFHANLIRIPWDSSNSNELEDWRYWIDYIVYKIKDRGDSLIEGTFVIVTCKHFQHYSVNP